MLKTFECSNCGKSFDVDMEEYSGETDKDLIALGTAACTCWYFEKDDE